MNQNWKKNYLEMKRSQLTDYQIEILEEGPKSLTQAWALGAMHYEWKQKTGQN